MSRRNTLQEKRVRRALRDFKHSTNKQPPAYIDLIEWLKSRSSVTTTGARRILLAGSLRVDSHTIGVVEHGKHKIIDRYVPAEYRGRIEIKAVK